MADMLGGLDEWRGSQNGAVGASIAFSHAMHGPYAQKETTTSLYQIVDTVFVAYSDAFLHHTPFPASSTVKKDCDGLYEVFAESDGRRGKGYDSSNRPVSQLAICSMVHY